MGLVDNPGTETATATLSRRAVVRRLAATTAVAWAAPQIVATDRAGAAGLSACVNLYDFDDGTTQGWSISGSGQSRWRISTYQSNSGSYSAWFGRNNTNGSVYPISGQPHYPGNSRGSLLSPLTDTGAFCDMSFNIRLTIENNASYDRLDLNLVQGGTRVKIWDKSMGGFTVVNHPSNPGSSWDLYTTNTAFVPIVVNVGNPAAIDFTQPVRYEFSFNSTDSYLNNTEGVFIDDVVLPCAAVGAISALPNGSQLGINGQTPRVDQEVVAGEQPPPPDFVPPPIVPVPEAPRGAAAGMPDPEADTVLPPPAPTATPSPATPPAPSGDLQAPAPAGDGLSEPSRTPNDGF